MVGNRQMTFQLWTLLQADQIDTTDANGQPTLLGQINAHE